MFSLIQNKKADSSATDGATIISEGSLFTGDVQSAASLRIDGRVVGNITCDNKVIIGATGLVEGNITAINIVVMGGVKGEMQAKEALLLRGKARVDGNIFTRMLTIEPEVNFNGRCQMDDSQVIEMDTAKKATPRTTRNAKIAEG